MASANVLKFGPNKKEKDQSMIFDKITMEDGDTAQQKPYHNKEVC